MAVMLKRLAAMCDDGTLLPKGKSVSINVSQAKQVLAAAAAGGHNPASVILGQICIEKGEGTARDLIDARNIWREAVNGSDRIAQDLVLRSTPPKQLCSESAG
jgi:TPR repeat protein